MPQSDGTVLIDTEIETDGMTAGTKEVEDAARRMASKIEGIGKKSEIALQKQVNSFIKQNQVYAQQEKKVESLRKKVEEYGNQKIPTQEYAEIQQQIEKARLKLERLIDRQEKFIEIGGKVNSKEYKSMQYDVDELSNTIKYARSELENLERTGKAFSLGTNTETAQKDIQKLALEEQKLAQIHRTLGTSYSSVKEKTDQYSKSLLKMDRNSKKANKSLKDTKKSANKARMSMGRMLATSILFSLVFRALSTVMTGIKEGFDNLAQYSVDTNKSLSMLVSSLEYLKNSFATAFAPILDVVAPILNRFIDMLATAANYVGAFFSALTGQSTYRRAVKTQKDYAESLESTSSGAKDAAKSTEEAEKAAEGYLSPLDEINKMEKKDNLSGTDSSGAGGLSPSEMFETVPIESKILTFADKVKKIMSEMFGPLKDAWGIYGPSIKRTLNLILQDFINFGARVGRVTIDWFKNLDWKPLLSSVDQLLIKFEPLINLLLNGLAWAYENILLPFGKWTIEKALPAILILLGNAFDFIRVVLERLQPLFQWLWDNVLEDYIKTLQNHAIEIINIFSGILTFLTGVFSENWEMAFSGLRQILISFQNIVNNIFGFVKNNILLPFDNFLQNVFAVDWTKVFGIFGEVMNFFSYSVSQIWFGIKNKFLGFIDFLSGVFTGNWKKALDGLKNIFKGTFESIFGIAKIQVNLIIGLLNGMISAIVSGINIIISKINSLSFTVPDWVPEIGGKTFGFDLPNITAPRIPYLASGAVIPPNSPFLAMLGDQKNGNNLEMPESLLRKIVREESAGKAGGVYRFMAQINRRVLFDEMIAEAKIRQDSFGRNPFETV